ncbi:MAG: 4Fe-4S ferredoxin [Ectothiorhodospiraceae bacterium]|nr:4Fe-4S ferredoxin [Ectothiorhodospiraceae bacterium]
MVREIIEINEALCDGCGDCVTECSEGAIKIIDGVAKLVKEQYCDGFGDCIGACPTGALKIVKKEVAAFDEEATKQFLLETQGEHAVRKMEAAQQKHAGEGNGHAMPALKVQEMPHRGGGCPGSVQRDMRKNAAASQPAEPAAGATIIPSELQQWPVQLHLVNPAAPYFQNSELVVLSTCGPVACAEVHQRYLRGRSVVVACPKLDRTDPYVEKLASIFAAANTPKVIIVVMEVPCCKGLTQMTAQAAQLSGRDDLIVEEHVLSLDGSIKGVRNLTRPIAHA